MSTALWLLFFAAGTFAVLGGIAYVKADRPGDDFSRAVPVLFCAAMLVLCVVAWLICAVIHWWPF